MIPLARLEITLVSALSTESQKLINCLDAQSWVIYDDRILERPLQELTMRPDSMNSRCVIHVIRPKWQNQFQNFTSIQLWIDAFLLPFSPINYDLNFTSDATDITNHLLRGSIFLQWQPWEPVAEQAWAERLAEDGTGHRRKTTS